MSREPSTEGVPSTTEGERRRPPLPPPATTPSTRKVAQRMRSLTYPPPPPRAESSTEAAQTPRDRGSVRSRTQEYDNPPQRTMPRRGDAPIGRRAQEQPLATPHRQQKSEQQGHSRQWEDRATMGTTIWW